jgi:peptide/nickel transport system permease protein
MGIAAPEAPDTTATSATVSGEGAAESPWRRFASEFAESGLALAGLALLVALVLVAIAAPYISPQNPYDLAQLDVLDSRLAPGEHSSTTGRPYWLGTDDQGRDMLSGIFYGLRISLAVGVASTVIALAIGLVLGLAAAYFGGWVDAAIMRVADIQLSFPAILIALVLLAILGQGVGKIIAALVAV